MPTSREFVFETGPKIVRSRSAHPLSFNRTQTMSAGRLYPAFCYSDVMPGDTFKLGASMVVRSSTPIAAVMDNAYIQLEFWWVPNVLTLSRQSMSPSVSDSTHSWVSFMGAQTNLLNVGADTHPEQVLPTLQYQQNSNITTGYYRRRLAHFLGYPYTGFSLSSLITKALAANNPYYPRFNPFAMLAFYQVWSDAYREPNLWNPVTYSIITLADGTSAIQFTQNAHAGIVSGDNIYTFTFPDICREHGYFGSSLPWPQRNTVGVSLSLADFAPLDVIKDSYYFPGAANGYSQRFMTYGGLSVADGFAMGVFNDGVTGNHDQLGAYASMLASSINDPTRSLVGTNLVADLQNATGFTINAFRYNLALQSYYEALSRLGNRYDDIIRNYGVQIDRPCCDRAEYLGGKRIPLNQVQVAASAASAGSPLGSIGGFSNTSDSAHYFTKSFNDFGTIIGVCFIRHHDTFGNRLSKERSRSRRFDYYLPQFANIGEVEVYRNELFVNFDPNGKKVGLEEDFFDGEVFGFQEYGATYRYHEDEIFGEVAPDVDGTIPYWTYADDWRNFCVNSNAGIGDLDLGSFLNAYRQEKEFDQTLQVSAASAGFQFLVQFYFDITAVRMIPTKSIPANLGPR